MIPPKNDPRWRSLVISEEALSLQAFPTKILFMRVRLLAKDGTPQKIDEAINIAFDYFTQNESIVRNDIEILFKNKGEL
jgi:hypothetical protein